jgi:formate dehydrogenase major subunit
MSAGMLNLTIDGRRLSVETGTTVLEAARRIGIDIPTLCHVEGLAPASSCFLCCVQVEGARALSPACALPAAEGMVVSSDSDDIRASRKMALELLLSDHAGDCIAPCSAGCPADLDIAAYVYQIASGRVDEAMRVLFDRLALPGSLGRICPRFCEQDCRRCDYDRQSLAIAALHRYSTDRNQQAEQPFVPQVEASSGKMVAIVGAGPAGLSAAFYLQQQGHACTLFDAHPEPGGMLRYGIPAYRLPRAALDAEVRVIETLGAVFRMGTRWGRDFSLAELRRDYDAVFIGIGAQQAHGLRCPGEDLAFSGLEFLRQVASGQTPDLGQRVVVIGGGNTAMDAARTALRFGAQVQVLYRRTRREMPCLMEEVEDAEKEGIRFEFLVAPIGLRRSDDGLRLLCQRMELGAADDSGRRRPVPIADAEFAVDCDTVIAAVGQAVDLSLAEAEGLEVGDWGLWTDEKTLSTNLPGVFAGGDAVLGADVAVRAVAAGRLAAVSLAQYLAGQPVTGPEEPVSIAMRPIDDAERAEIFREIEKSARVTVSTLDWAERSVGFAEVNQGLDNDAAGREARRCMSCGCRKAEGCTLRQYASQYRAEPYRFLGQRRRFEQDTSHPEVVYEPGKCILCDACVRVAAEAGEALGLSAIGRGFDVSVGVPFDRPLSEGLRAVAARCAQVCPTGALALRSARSCDLAACGGLVQIESADG